MKMIVSYLFLIWGLLLFTSCEEPVYTPKPRAYPKIEFPERSYTTFDKDYCSFTFKYPAYAEIERDTTFFDEPAKNPCWFNIYVPALNSRLHMSYYDINSDNTFEKLRSDAFDLASKHNIKANYIDELPIQRPDGTTGMAFDIEGPVASPFQFYLSDGRKHFLRGALYFETQARPDSLAPVYNFMKTEVMEMINTLEWKE